MICRMGREFDKLRFRVFLEYKFMQHQYVTKYSMFHIHFTLSLLYISTYLLYRFRFVHMLLLETCKPKFLLFFVKLPAPYVPCANILPQSPNISHNTVQFP